MGPTSSARIRAARLNGHGEPLVVEELELPAAGADEVRVELQFAGVNPVDRYGAEGRVAPNGPLPRTLGAEASGTLDGESVLVAGEGLGSARDGVWAQAAVVPRAALTPIPAGVDPREAAAMGIAGLTALNVVRNVARVRAEDRVLVLGASGGVGSIIVSLVHSSGATVWGQTGSPDKVAGVTAQGADRVLVAGPGELGSKLIEFAPTVVFDPLGGGFVRPAVEALQTRGRIVSFGTSAGAEVEFNLQSLYRKSGRLLGYGGMQLGREERQAGLKAALRALQKRELRVPIDSVLPLQDVNDAFRRLTERAVQGNLLLDLS
jgi:NADPH2:quinone reductase